MPAYLYAVIGVSTLLWLAPMAVRGYRNKAPRIVDRRARWGMIMEAISYSLLWQGSFWTRSPGGREVAIAIAFLALACALSWGGAHALGRHFRTDAGLDAQHKLVQSGPYRMVRHPIYTSMLCIIIGTGLIVATPLLLMLSIVVFLIGSEIRVRIEDRLLAERFGEAFRDYRAKTSRYIPLVW